MMSRTVRQLAAALAFASLGPATMAAAGPSLDAPTPVAVSDADAPATQAPAVSSEAGRGWGDKVMCIGCMAGGLLALSAGAGFVLGVAASGAGSLAIIACIDACVEAY
jgi:hypothetical protein